MGPPSGKQISETGGHMYVSIDTTQYNGDGFPLFPNKRHLIHMLRSTKCQVILYTLRNRFSI